VDPCFKALDDLMVRNGSTPGINEAISTVMMTGCCADEEAAKVKLDEWTESRRKRLQAVLDGTVDRPSSE